MKPQFANSALSRERSVSTFELQVLRDKQKKLELGRRMHKLWEESGRPQEAIADAIGLKHRSYQKALQTGGISYEKLERLAELHGVDVDWLLRGDAPDLMSSLNGVPQLDRIERKIDQLLTRVPKATGAAGLEDLDAELDRQESAPDEEDEDEPGTG